MKAHIKEAALGSASAGKLHTHVHMEADTVTRGCDLLTDSQTVSILGGSCVRNYVLACINYVKLYISGMWVY